ncbi:MAG: hypothetical protein AAGA02_14275 [Bacteroidota bacterium]
MFADTHVHPLMKYVHNDRKNLWDSFEGPFHFKGLINNFIGIPAFSQADFCRLAQGNVQIIFCALHPPEQKIMFHKLKDSNAEGFLEEVASQAISIPPKKINDFQKPDYDHFEQLTKELQILMSGTSSFTTIAVKGVQKRAKYFVCKNFIEVEKVLERNKMHRNEHNIAVIPTIEGLHSLGIGHVVFKGENSNPKNVSEAKFLERLDNVKGLSNNEGPGWIYSPIVANLTHAFDNKLCGHAQALSNLFQLLFEYAEPYGPYNGPQQIEGLNKGLTVFGEIVIKRMLNLDGRLNPGKRIIPDIKHMSVRTRIEYYQIIDAYNEANPDNIIPVIMSHAAVNGKVRLSDHLDPEDLQKEWENSTSFNPWSINLFDDEILRVLETKGLIGVIFDQRVLSGGMKLKALKNKIDEDSDELEDYFKGKNKKRRWALLIVDQVYHIIKTAYNSGRDDWAGAWNIICIGSDFDGQIDPIDSFNRVTHYNKFKRIFKKMLKRDNRFDHLMGGNSINEIADKICFNNVFEFLKRYYS